MIFANEVERDLWLREQGRYLGHAVIGSDLMMQTIMRDAAAWADAAVDAYRERTPEAHGYVEDPEPCPCRAKIVFSGANATCTKCGQSWRDEYCEARGSDDPVDSCADMAENAAEIRSSMAAEPVHETTQDRVRSVCRELFARSTRSSLRTPDPENVAYRKALDLMFDAFNLDDSFTVDGGEQ